MDDAGNWSGERDEATRRRAFLDRIEKLESGAAEQIRRVEGLEEHHTEVLLHPRYVATAGHVEEALEAMRTDAERMIDDAAQLRWALGLPPRGFE